MITILILMSQITLAEVLTETSDICSPVLQQIWKDKILKNRYFPKIVILCQQLLNHVATFLSPHLCGYRKSFSVQYALFLLLEKRRKTIDNEGFADGVLMDFSEAFDTFDYQLLITKIRFVGFGKESLMLF